MESTDAIFELFSEWYGVNITRLDKLKTFSDEKFAILWTDIWFAKNKEQVKIDKYLEKYIPLFSIDNPDESMPNITNTKYKLVWKIGWMLLWDQISRNVFRNTAKAYETDEKARKLVEEIMPQWDDLPIPIRVSIILVFIHSENIDDLPITNMLLKDIKEPMRNFPTVWIALNGIARNHSERMLAFGRIPERNKFLGRQSTDAELAYMSSFSAI